MLGRQSYNQIAVSVKKDIRGQDQRTVRLVCERLDGLLQTNGDHTDCRRWPSKPVRRKQGSTTWECYGVHHFRTFHVWKMGAGAQGRCSQGVKSCFPSSVRQSRYSRLLPFIRDRRTIARSEVKRDARSRRG